jgi:voltage-dependent calcium channel L type alpha-1D
LRNLLIAMERTVMQLTNFSILIMLFIIIFVLLGEEFFAYQIRFKADGSPSEDLESGNSPIWNFDNFGNGVLSVFAIISGEYY